MSIVEAIVLGLVQGITEFLPVSSDGHLAIISYLFGLDMRSRLPFTVMLHAATGAAMLVFLAPTIVRLARGLGAAEITRRRGSWATLLFIAVASLPTGIVGYLLGERLERALSSPHWIGLMLLISGGIVFGTRYVSGSASLNWWRAGLVGLAQAVGIVPAISRSGATISIGLYAGLDRQVAFDFSFLLALPAIAGALLLEAPKLDFAAVPPAALAAGLPAAFVCGLGALYLLRSALLGRRLHWFAYYCWAAGVATILFVR